MSAPPGLCRELLDRVLAVTHARNRIRTLQPGSGRCDWCGSVLLGLVLVAVVGCLERRAAYAADHWAVFDLLGGHVQLAGRLAGAFDGDAAAAALLRLAPLLARLAGP